MKIAESILGQMAAPVLVVHEYSHAIFANPSFYDAFHVPPGQLRDKSPTEVLENEPETSQLRTILETVINHEGNIEGVVLECPENPRIFSMSSRRLTFEGHPTDMMLVEMFDITREREREAKISELNAALVDRKAELEQMNQDLESFTHSASHDLRTPLRLINRISHILLERYGGVLPPEAREMIVAISNSTNDVGELLEKLLSFSRVNHSAMRKRKIDFGKLVTTVAADLAEAQQIDLDCLVVEDLPVVYADRTLLKQVMVNLLSNAGKFTGKKKNKEIRVGQCIKNGKLVFFVRDNGIGFDGAEAESIFAPFRRLKTVEKYDGTGIGLALVKRIVDHHGGQIWADGQRGLGATIYFTLGDKHVGEPGADASGSRERRFRPLNNNSERAEILGPEPSMCDASSPSDLDSYDQD